jgi:hypothetical protein
MNKDLARKLPQVGICRVCAILVWRYSGDLGASEFSGGRVTGPLLEVYDTGMLLFILAMPLTFFFRRTAAAVSVLASLFCLPLYFYFTAPGPFRRIFPGEYSVRLEYDFVWTGWGIVGILALAVAAGLGFRGLLARAQRNPEPSR